MTLSRSKENFAKEVFWKINHRKMPKSRPLQSPTMKKLLHWGTDEVTASSRALRGVCLENINYAKSSKDQHFLIDKEIIIRMVLEAGVCSSDRVLDIGAGRGNISKVLIDLTGKVIAIEIERGFEIDLRKIKNLQVEIGDALVFLRKNKEWNKMVSNIPFQLCEPLMRILCEEKFEVAVLIVPLSFYVVLGKHPLFSAFFNVEKIIDVPKEAFLPAPKVKSVMVRLKKRDEIDGEFYFVRQLYLQRDKKLKNALREIVIEYYGLKCVKLSKKEATALLLEMKIPASWFEIKMESLPVKSYSILGEEIERIV